MPTYFSVLYNLALTLTTVLNDSLKDHQLPSSTFSAPLPKWILLTTSFLKLFPQLPRPPLSSCSAVSLTPSPPVPEVRILQGPAWYPLVLIAPLETSHVLIQCYGFNELNSDDSFKLKLGPKAELIA